MIRRMNFGNCFVSCFLLILAHSLNCQFIQGQIKEPRKPLRNSTRKIRTKPSKIAAKAGSAVNWAESFEHARQTSKSTGKPIFWYVPTVRGTFMDRRPVVDRYMMAGYFSWPEIINCLNQNFVPVKAAPTKEQQQKHQLSAYEFVEPGFLILSPRGAEKAKVDRLTTQHKSWMLRFLNQHVRPDSKDRRPTPEISRDLEITGQFSDAVRWFQSGKQSRARELWQEIARKNQDHPLGWKSAAEAQGIGPFVRGFEVFDAIPERAYRAGLDSAGSAAPANTYSQSEIWKRSVGFLLNMQDENGGFFDSDYDFGGTDSLPNVHVAVTSLSALALMSSRNRVDPRQKMRVDSAVRRSLKYVSDEKNLNRIDRDEILWADSYRLRLLARNKSTNFAPAFVANLQEAVVSLENLQTRRGTWYHEYENPFVTATALVALYDAHRAGANVDQNRIQSGVDVLGQLRRNDGSFPYGGRKGEPGPTTVPASAGRMPLCELALYDWGRADQQRLQFAIEQSFKFHHHLNSALKYDNHTSTFGYGGFFFWYDMRSRTEAIAAISDAQLRNNFMRKQLAIIMKLPEIDGCFVDSHELGRCYGTAMALLCLDQIENVLKD